MKSAIARVPLHRCGSSFFSSFLFVCACKRQSLRAVLAFLRTQGHTQPPQKYVHMLSSAPSLSRPAFNAAHTKRTTKQAGIAHTHTTHATVATRHAMTHRTALSASRVVRGDQPSQNASPAHRTTHADPRPCVRASHVLDACTSPLSRVAGWARQTERIHNKRRLSCGRDFVPCLLHSRCCAPCRCVSARR